MSENVLQLPLTGNSRENYRYGLYFHKLTAPDGAPYTRPLIVLRNEYGDIVCFTKLHIFSEPFSEQLSIPITSSSNERLYHICAMLNFTLIKNGIDHVFNVSWDMVNTFFQSYAYEQGSNGKFRSRATIEKCIRNVTDFFHRLKSKYGEYVLLKPDELYNEKTVYNRNGQQVIRRVPLFQVKHIPQHSDIFRELPTSAFEVMLTLAFRYAPDIAFAICLQAFAGLRAGEICNIRQDSLKLTLIEDHVQKVEIDLTRERPMRSDGVLVGKIKKKRKQCVYPPFLQAFCAAYEHHKVWLTANSFEESYRPMFVNAKGLAMTYKDYSRRFEKLVSKHLRKELFGSDNPEMRIYGQMLYENRLGLHALRHWFSVQLVLHGEDIAQIQYWRGDKSPESAFTYLQNKGDLLRELQSGSEFLSEILMSEGARLLD